MNSTQKYSNHVKLAPIKAKGKKEAYSPTPGGNANGTLSNLAQTGIKDHQGIDQIYVQKWVDYSAKYGLGYIMSDQTIGVFFNDNTKMIADKDGDQSVNYIYCTKTKDKQQPSNFILIDNFQKISLMEYPPELKKKITLYKHFYKYFKSKKLK